MNSLIRALLGILVFAGGCVPVQPGQVSTREQITWMEQEQSDHDFRKADQPRTFDFPADHGAHPEYQTEWWYFTGNLSTDQGRQFGYQLTFFRRGLTPDPVKRTSEWAASNIYMAHFAVTDVQADNFIAQQRFSRDGNNLAGAESTPYTEIWLESWKAQQQTDKNWRLQADTQEVSLDLILNDLTGPALQGESGLSKKGEGNASYYYSLPRLQSKGTIKVGDTSYAVSGLSWMDHEFSTSVLTRDQIGWDWFGIQLDDGTSLMFFTLRREDGSPDPYSTLSLIDESGKVENMAAGQWQVEPVTNWKSPHSGGEYPSGWKLTVPGQGLQLTITPKVQDQELNLSFIYWEGAVQVEGSRAGGPISGQGYVELTGYAHPMEGL